MKKIFTLLLCVVALTAAAEIDQRTEQCINALLGNTAPTKVVLADLDADQDGVLTIADVTTLIDLSLEQQVNRAPSQEIDINGLAKEILESPNHDPDITDMSKAVDENLKRK